MFAQTSPGSGSQQFIFLINRFNVQHVWLAYGLAVLITGVVGLVAFGVFLMASAQELHIAEAIRLNTDQRMYMQRATLLMNLLSTEPREAFRSELIEQLRFIEQDRAIFVQESQSYMVPAEVVTTYSERLNVLDSLLDRFLILSHQIADQPDADFDDLQDQFQAILMISPSLREAYNQVIRIYDDIDLEQATNLRTFAFFFILILLTVLILEVLLIFRPMEHRLRQQHDALTSEIERRKQMESALRQSEESYRLLAQHLPDMAVLMFDHNLRYTLADGSALAAIGYSRERIEGKTLEESVSASGYQILEPYYRGTLQEQSASLEHRTLGRDYFTQFVPVYDEQQKIIGGLVTSQDITARKQAEETIRLSEARFRSITENVTDMVALLDKDFCFVYANPSFATTLGYIPAQLLGKNVFDFVYSEDRDWLNARRFSRDPRNEKLDLVEFRHYHADGHYLWVECHISYLIDSTGEVQGVVAFLRDLTETHRLRDLQIQQTKLQTSLNKEQELSELKSQMMLRITHEFRTPLAIIWSAFETLDHYGERLTPVQRVTKRQMIDRQIRKLTQMLDNISVVVRSDSDTHGRIKDIINLLDLLKEVVIAVEAELDQSNRFVLNVPESLHFHGDTIRLKQAFREIFMNAARYSGRDTFIQVRAELQETTVKIQIKDQGIGIPPDEQARIMEPFFRGSNINERGGLGLGLPLAHDVVKAHEGRLSVSSQEHVGTTVTVSLPS